MKKFLKTALALCMILAVVPMTFASAETETLAPVEVGDTIGYAMYTSKHNAYTKASAFPSDFKTGAAIDAFAGFDTAVVTNPVEISYENGTKNIDCVAASGNRTSNFIWHTNTTNSFHSPGVRLSMSETETQGYAAFTIKVPNGNYKYDLDIAFEERSEHSSGAKGVEFWIAPKGETNPTLLMRTDPTIIVFPDDTDKIKPYLYEDTLTTTAGTTEYLIVFSPHTGQAFSVMGLSLTRLPDPEPVKPGEETVLNDVYYSVAATAGENFTINDEEKNSTGVSTTAHGTAIMVTANPSDSGKVFRGWYRGGENGDLVCLDTTYTHTATTNFSLFAKYTDPGEAKEYYDWNGEYINSTGDDPDAKYGYSFEGYVPAATVDGITRYVANYTGNIDCTITGDGIANGTTTVKFDAPVTAKLASAVTWLKNEKPIYYGKEYNFFATGNDSITTNDAENTDAKVMLTKLDAKTYVLEYDHGDAVVVEKGIIFGDGTPTVNSCSYKVVSQKSETHGQMIAVNDAGKSAVLGYIIYKDGDAYRVIYAD